MTKPRYIRTALFVPGDHAKAMERAHERPADALIFDLEDGVSPDAKDEARAAIVEALASKRFAHHYTVVRMNHISTEAGEEDVKALSTANCDALMLSKVAGGKETRNSLRFIAQYGGADKPIWANIETPSGVMNVQNVAEIPQVKALVCGTNDLANDLRIKRTPDRGALMYSLQKVQLVARATGCLVLDGTFMDVKDEAGLRAESEQGRHLGFDGKTLIHPAQIDVANTVFSPTEEELARAKQIIETYEREAINKHKAVCLMGSEMIERLHYDRAKEMVA